MVRVYRERARDREKGPAHTCTRVRNGTFAGLTRLTSVCDTPISCTTSSAGSTRPSTPFHSSSAPRRLSVRANRNFSYEDVHVKGAEAIASLATQAGVDRFVHVSHLNAAHDSPSAFYRTKAVGEERVKEAFPNATIIRPSIMFGYEDRLLNNVACECGLS